MVTLNGFPYEAFHAPVVKHAVYRPGEGGWQVERTSDTTFRISGGVVERLVGRHDLENPEALDEIDPGTMASRVCPGLFLVGEILDVDGRLGGFNFQWAWSSAWFSGSPPT